MKLYKEVYLYLIVLISFSKAEELGSCFGKDTEVTCENNQAAILGKFYNCKVLKRFENEPKNLALIGKDVFLGIDDFKLKYSFETDTLLFEDYNSIDHIKKYEVNNILFRGGNGKATVRFPYEKNTMEIVTVDEEKTFDNIEFSNKSQKIFVLSHSYNKSKVEGQGSLFVLDVNNIIEEDSTILAEKVNTMEQKFSSMVVVPDKNMLLLTGKDDIGGKLIALSLIENYPCNNETNAEKYDSNENIVMSFEQKVYDTEIQLVALLNQFYVESIGTNETVLKVETDRILTANKRLIDLSDAIRNSLNNSTETFENKLQSDLVSKENIVFKPTVRYHSSSISNVCRNLYSQLFTLIFSLLMILCVF